MVIQEKYETEVTVAIVLSIFEKVMKDCAHLVHLDLSWNRINKEDSQKIAMSVLNNQTLYGFHFDGNRGTLDEK